MTLNDQKIRRVIDMVISNEPLRALLNASLNSTLSRYNESMPAVLDRILASTNSSEVVSIITNAIMQTNATTVVQKVFDTVYKFVNLSVSPSNQTSALAESATNAI
jgi:hypothetical protein